jgi:hypothetical protein
VPQRKINPSKEQVIASMPVSQQSLDGAKNQYGYGPADSKVAQALIG